MKNQYQLDWSQALFYLRSVPPLVIETTSIYQLNKFISLERVSTKYWWNILSLPVGYWQKFFTIIFLHIVWWICIIAQLNHKTNWHSIMKKSIPTWLKSGFILLKIGPALGHRDHLNVLAQQIYFFRKSFHKMSKEHLMN